MKNYALLLSILFLGHLPLFGQEPDTLPPLVDGRAPANFEEMWAGFDPRAEPLDVETIKVWEEDDVVLRIVRFRIGMFKGTHATLAAIYGFPKRVQAATEKIPGLVQIHGGGQYADHRACLTNAKRGYATVSIAWAGRISAPDYRVSPPEVKLFWEGRTDDPTYRLTTDWGAVDGYHAPGRNAGNSFPSAKAAPWTLDSVESPRNSGWFLCAIAARRALTFLEQQPEVDRSRLGVYGHSMGGKLTVMAAVDPRVKAAAPSCGGISDRDNASPLFRSTIGDEVSLKHVSCPIIFLSPSNDFHGRIGDLPAAVEEIESKQWRVTCSPHHNHQDTAAFEVATQLWFDEHLKGTFDFPESPVSELQLVTADRVPTFMVQPDRSHRILSVDVFYTQHGKTNETPANHEDTKSRFWHHVDPTESNGQWTAQIPVATAAKPLWVYANVLYELDTPVKGSGYYYGPYEADSFNVSSLIKMVAPADLADADVRADFRPTLIIEDFADDWEKEWFTYRPNEWARSTHKVRDEMWRAPVNATLAMEVLAHMPNRLVMVIDDYAADIEVKGSDQWQEVQLSPTDFINAVGDTLPNWQNIRRLKLCATERLRPPRGDSSPPRTFGRPWEGDDPHFRNLRWQKTSPGE